MEIETNNKTKINKKASKGWMKCPRCGGHDTEKRTQSIFAYISSSLGLGSLIYLISAFLFPPLFILSIIVVIVSPFMGIIAKLQPEYKCNTCGAEWDKKGNNNNNNKGNNNNNNDDNLLDRGKIE